MEIPDNILVKSSSIIIDQDVGKKAHTVATLSQTVSRSSHEVRNPPDPSEELREAKEAFVQAVKKRIKAMREQGISCKEIAKVLNAEKLTPPGGHWHPTSVWRIVRKIHQE